ncbi:hypothetical protein LWI28_016531 [Acer negundo]|uniref:Uncharacterized protein n=1 Tax=Acer negundo TaxID=4023 RepID=A0AAD5ILZ4_ACENE|nr:hypothetical protein LWI28_016531 [Acer negundo]
MRFRERITNSAIGADFKLSNTVTKASGHGMNRHRWCRRGDLADPAHSQTAHHWIPVEQELGNQDLSRLEAVQGLVPTGQNRRQAGQVAVTLELMEVTLELMEVTLELTTVALWQLQRNRLHSRLLVKTLLEKGHTVRTTVRDPENVGKVGFLWEFNGAKERLKMIKADLLEEGSFDEAIKGVDGCFTRHHQ